MEHPHGGLSAAVDMLLDYGKWSYCFPILALVLGLWLLRSKPKAEVFFEWVVGVTRLLAFVWAAYCLVIWQA